MPDALPPPPAGRTGWPWDTPPPVSLPGEWPRITVVTPSYNQGRFLEATLRSIHLQGYPNLEHIVIDGGSSDESVAILERYSPHLAYWVSEPDRGQSHALNKGFAHATGDLMVWINSDDMLAPGALQTVAERFRQGDCDIITGHTRFVDSDGTPGTQYTAGPSPASLVLRMGGFPAPQPSTYWTRQVWAEQGPLAEDLHLAMDFDLWIRMAAANYRWVIVDHDLALFRHHADQKTHNLPQSRAMLAEKRLIFTRFLASALCTPALRRDARHGLNVVWVKEWKLDLLAAPHPRAFPLRWLIAPFRYPGCLTVRAYYGTLVRWATKRKLRL